MKTPLVVILNNEIMPYRLPLFEMLAERANIRIHVLYSGKHAPERQWTLDHNQLHYDFTLLPSAAIQLKKQAYQDPRTMWITPTLPIELARLKPDIVIGYEFSLQALIAQFYSRIARIPYITWTEMTAHTDRGLTTEQRWTRRYLMPRTDAFIGTSTAACDNLTDKGIDPHHIILAPQTLDMRQFAAQSSEWRAKSAPHPPTVLYVGFLSERKGLIHLIESFRLVQQQVPDVVLRLVGEGDQRSLLMAKVSEYGLQAHVEFTGFIEPHRMPQVYAEADVFVLPSLEDTFGVVATEAISSKVPLICSQYAGFASHLTDGENAYIVDPQDPKRLAECITELLFNPELRAKFIEASQLVLAACAPEQVATMFEQACQIAQTEYISRTGSITTPPTALDGERRA